MRSVYFLLVVFVLIFSEASFAQVAISVTFGPPALPVYEQPPCPAEGFIWIPGYWAYDYDFDDYFWVPGTWVLAPEPGFFWTPPYWAWNGGAFVFYEGYWAPVVGFYGGIDYGYGYFGNGYVGGRWEGGRFFYNRAVTNVNVTNITNVYNDTTVVNRNVSHISYKGGAGGTTARPTPQQETATHERHIGPVAAQTQQVQAARSDAQLRASTNKGKPPIAATPKPGEFGGGGVVKARDAGGPYNPPANRGRGASSRGNEGAARPAVHPNELPPLERPSPRDTGNAQADEKYQKEQEKLYERQQQERQQMQQQQEKDHEQLGKHNADEAQKQQLEQKHQQQTHEMEQRHQTEREKGQPPPRSERREPPQ